MINPHHVGFSIDYPNLRVKDMTHRIRQYDARAVQSINGDYRLFIAFLTLFKQQQSL